MVIFDDGHEEIIDKLRGHIDWAWEEDNPDTFKGAYYPYFPSPIVINATKTRALLDDMPKHMFFGEEETLTKLNLQWVEMEDYMYFLKDSYIW